MKYPMAGNDDQLNECAILEKEIITNITKKSISVSGFC